MFFVIYLSLFLMQNIHAGGDQSEVAEKMAKELNYEVSKEHCEKEDNCFLKFLLQKIDPKPVPEEKNDDSYLEQIKKKIDLPGIFLSKKITGKRDFFAFIIKMSDNKKWLKLYRLAEDCTQLIQEELQGDFVRDDDFFWFNQRGDRFFINKKGKNLISYDLNETSISSPFIHQFSINPMDMVYHIGDDLALIAPLGKNINPYFMNVQYDPSVHTDFQAYVLDYSTKEPVLNFCLIQPAYPVRTMCSGRYLAMVEKGTNKFVVCERAKSIFPLTRYAEYEKYSYEKRELLKYVNCKKEVFIKSFSFKFYLPDLDQKVLQNNNLDDYSFPKFPCRYRSYIAQRDCPNTFLGKRYLKDTAMQVRTSKQNYSNYWKPLRDTINMKPLVMKEMVRKHTIKKRLTMPIEKRLKLGAAAGYKFLLTKHLVIQNSIKKRGLSLDELYRLKKRFRFKNRQIVAPSVSQFLMAKFSLITYLGLSNSDYIFDKPD